MLIGLHDKSLKMSGNFEERSGLVISNTDWGNWGQTMEEIFIEVDVPVGTPAKTICCDVKPTKIKLQVQGKDIINGELCGTVIADESIWTLEDKRLIRITLVKAKKDAANCWQSLLRDKYSVDPFLFDQMERKLTLERFQKENPGFDFSGAEVTGNYHGGGPVLPE